MPAEMPGSALAPSRPRLSDAQCERYSRQMILDEVGVEGQGRLLAGKVLIVGAGGLGSPAALYLAAAGVGTIGVVDADRVDLSNLHRQVLHHTSDVGRMKTESAERTMRAVNPDVRVVQHPARLSSGNALAILAPYDLVINGCDNFPTRYLVNDACVMLKKPLVDASILRWEGQATVFMPGQGCYRCLFPSPPPPGSVPSCAEAGIIGALAGHMGTLQAVEAIKILLGLAPAFANRLLLFDALSGDHTVVRWEQNPDCPVCGRHPSITRLVDYEAFCALASRTSPSPGVPDGAPKPLPPGAPAPTRRPDGSGVLELAPREVHDWMERDAAVQLVDVREPWEWRQRHVAEARPIPMGEVKSRLGEIDRDRPVVVMCHSGGRSAQISKWLMQEGYPHVYNLAGGIVRWAADGLPVEGPQAS